MYDRLLIAVSIIAFGIAVFQFMRFIATRKVSENLLALPGRRKGAALIVYFTSRSCGICKAAQAPALNSLQENIGQKLQVITINVDEDMETACRWNVMTLPTTFVFSAKGVLLHHNIGLADAAKLSMQLNKRKISARKLSSEFVSCEKSN